MKIVNLPAGDHRVSDFSGKLYNFIIDEADGLPFPSVLGAIDIVKLRIMLDQEK